MAEKPKVTSAGSINVSKQFAANKSNTSAAAKPAATPVRSTTSGGYSGIPATPSRTTTTGGYSGIPITTTKPTTQTKPITTPKQGPSSYDTSRTYIPGGADAAYDIKTGFNRATNTYGPPSESTTGFPAAGTFAGYELSGDRKQRRARFHDGKGGFYYGAFEANPDYKEEDTKTKTPNVAYDTIQKILESYRITGLASVLESIRDEYPEASSEELMTLLQFDDRYNAKFNERFAGNVTRMKAGKSVYSPGEYLKLEQAFDKVLTSYNQPTFKNQTYYDKWIVGDVDPVEVSERVQLGYDRVLSDDPVTRAFNKFYSALGYSDIVAGMLDPVNQLPALQQKVKAAEIGGAALRQGFKPDEISLEATGSTLGADILAKQGITKEEAEAGYSKIAGLLPTAEKLSSIYSTTEQKYGRLEAEEEEFQGLASAERKRKRLSSLETAQFQGSSGVGESGISTQNLRRSSSAGQY